MNKSGINIPGLKYRESGNFLLIAGPCVVEGEDVVNGVSLCKVKMSAAKIITGIFIMPAVAGYNTSPLSSEISI